jgi:hypothetical protein
MQAHYENERSNERERLENLNSQTNKMSTVKDKGKGRARDLETED